MSERVETRVGGGDSRIGIISIELDRNGAQAAVWHVWDFFGYGPAYLRLHSTRRWHGPRHDDPAHVRRVFGVRRRSFSISLP